MSTAYHVDPEYEVVLYRPAGRFTESDFIALLRAAWSDPIREPHFAHVWLTHAVDELAMDATVIPMYRDLLAAHDEQITTGKVAVVTTRALTRRFASMVIQVGRRHRGTFRIFEAVDAAAEWTGVPVEVLTKGPDADWTSP
jgi:hypothetical protein